MLSDREIRNSLKCGEIEITGWYPEPFIGPSSVDLHLDNKAMILDKRKFAIGEPMHFAEKEKSADKFTEYNGWNEITIHPGEFYILSSVEKLKFADDIVGFIQGRSSVARMGINVHAAGFFDCGFEGTATLEVTNFTSQPVIIPKYTRICQMTFARTGLPAEIPYGMKKDSKYQNQSGPTITKISNDYKNEN